MKPAHITIERGDRGYRYLWLKYVTGIDLSQHCARSLHGPYSPSVDLWAPCRVAGGVALPVNVSR